MEGQDDRKVVLEIEVAHYTETKHLIDTKVTPLADTNVATPASIEQSVHTGGGFPRAPNVCTFISEYANHVALRLRHAELFRLF